MMRKAQLLNQQQVNEKKLFHGTCSENVETICEKNFHLRLHNKNKRPKLGQGTYFAVNAVSSHSYAKRDSDLFQYMFLAKVLVGYYTKGHPSYQSPPPKYDSCVDDKSNPTIFVVFDTDQFYPEYVIKYSSQTTSEHYRAPGQPKPAPLSKPPGSQTYLLPQRSSNNLHGTAPNTSKTAVRSGYSTSTSGTGPAARNAPRSVNSLGTASKPSGSAASSEHSKVPQTHSVSYNSSKPTTPMPKPPSTQTYPQGIVKHPPSSSNNPVSTQAIVYPAQFKSSTSAVSNSGLVNANTRTSTTLNPSGSAAQSGYPTMSQAPSAANGSSPQPRKTTRTRSPNPQTHPKGILKHQPSPSTFPIQIGYTASTASSSGLTRENPIRSSNDLRTASNPSGSFARSGCSSNVRSCTSSRGFQTATNSNLRRKKKKKCVLQ
ncbi:cell wall protein RBR3-like [Orbicella faveolata]|uniref:cell wall protein RBR3-like n=1 Tax=Orbicella faveolata TaxID=48498 RepID=UPI0009E64A04|nr:cell wall protein RBR3-like [Orbicella faveolata]